MSLTLLDKRPFNPNECMPWKGMRRCALTPDGIVFKYHDKDNTDLWEDGTQVDWSDYENQGLNCMVEIPKFYYKKVGFNESEIDFENGHAWYISDTPATGFELHPAFMRCRDKLCDDLTGEVKEVNYRYAPAFLGSIVNSKLRSLPNKLPQTSITIGQARNYAKVNSNGWGILDYNLYFAIQLLYLVEYGDYDSQTALGKGYVDGNSSEINTGGTLQYGNHSFGEITGKNQMSYRGIEDFWGNCVYWIDGFYYDSNYNILIGNKGFNNNGNGYTNHGKGATSNISGYISDIQNNKNYGFVMSTNNGSETTKLYDYGYLLSGCLPIAGGNWYNGSAAGAFSFYCGYSASASDSYISYSLTF
ncbi:uncharacterized protein CBO05P1_140 [Clostridium botulinum B str. Osaka05]|uniref:Uncharacterized protein n=1 Tax=Clostridium botulinum B str. Osaka05 TaxID=1407017 RepID=A0A060N9I0_CLOBO|nr:hypothetical protein [Clostridium botulinum]BAO04859.1 uncharacterized protein CBO05P1_140 [Clostridium botulinum B str. Osaka05]